jgi:hypothetical protein
MQIVKKIWKASGKRQAMSRGAKEKPSVSLCFERQQRCQMMQDCEVAYQLLMLNPVIQFAIWIITSLPRLCILLVSLCQTWVYISYGVYKWIYHLFDIHLLWLYSYLFRDRQQLCRPSSTYMSVPNRGVRGTTSSPEEHSSTPSE